MTKKENQEISNAINDITETVKYHMDELKKLIIEYFSDELQHDETPSGALRRNQIRKKLLEFANK